MIDPRFSTAALALALAACQQAPDSETANAANMTESADVVTLPPDESMVPPGNAAGNDSGEDTGNATEPAPPGTIPAAFHGRWGMVPADCTSTRGDAKGLITVSADMIRFYESRARLTRIVEDSPERLTGDFAFTGEGQEWSKRQTLTLTGSSNTLTRSEPGTSERFSYTRCRT